MEKYFSVEREAENEIVIERSRFITYVKSVSSEQDAREFIDSIRKKHSLATHNCYAYVCEKGNIKRFSDDGEPSGTAGQPILEAITSKGLVDTGVVVTRYFGGVKLGAGGLVRAYSKSASEGLKVGGIAEFLWCSVLSVYVSYDKLPRVTQVLSSCGAKVIKTLYDQEVKVEFATKTCDEQKVRNALSEALSGKVNITLIKNDFMQLTDI